MFLINIRKLDNIFIMLTLDKVELKPLEIIRRKSQMLTCKMLMENALKSHNDYSFDLVCFLRCLVFQYRKEIIEVSMT